MLHRYTPLAPNFNSSSRTKLVSVGGKTLRVGADDKLSEGGQAFLYLVREDSTGRSYVLKKTRVLHSEVHYECATKEIAVLKAVSHPNIVEYVGSEVGNPEEVLLLLEFCAGGHLLGLINSQPEIKEHTILFLCRQVCLALEYLHMFRPHPVAHRDVKLENILMSADQRTVKLCDFGSSTSVHYQVVGHQERGVLESDVQRFTTPSYRAPELVDLFSGKQVTEQVDVWALGCVLYSMAFKKHAFGTEGTNLAILNGRYVIPPSTHFSDQYLALFPWLFLSDPVDRPRIGDVLDYIDEVLETKPSVSSSKRGSGRGDRPYHARAALEVEDRVMKPRKGMKKRLSEGEVTSMRVPMRKPANAALAARWVDWFVIYSRFWFILLGLSIVSTQCHSQYTY